MVMNNLVVKRKPNPRLLGILLTGAVIAGGTVYLGLMRGGWVATKPLEAESAETALLPSVAALGRLELAGEIIQIAAPLTLDGDRLAELMVKTGDTVRAGDPIATLDSRDRLRDDVTQAHLQIRIAEAKLAQVKAGAKSGAIAAQAAAVTQQSAELSGQVHTQRELIARIQAQLEGDRTAQTAMIRRLDAELRTAEAELSRYHNLYQDGAVSASLYDSKRWCSL